MVIETVRRVKLLPPQPGPWMITRPRLHSLLDRTLTVPMTLVIAPAGYGKTSLIGEWAANQARAGWLSLDRSDNEFPRFLHGFLAALQSMVPESGNATLGLLRLGQEASPIDCAGSLADELLDLVAPVIVVVDDFHEMDCPEIPLFLDALFRHPPPMLHLVIATRNEPGPSFAALMARGRVLELRLHDLAFTVDEAREVLSQVHGPVSQDIAEAAIETTEGWAAGIHLAMLNHGFSRPDGSGLANFTTPYLTGEVLDRQPGWLQDVLLRLSIASRLTPELAAVLTGSATGDRSGRDLIEGIARAGLFLSPLGRKGEWFRFHSLFRSMLLDRLHQRFTSNEITSLHRTAARWFGSHNDIEAGIRHAFEAEDEALAAAIVRDNAQLALATDRWLEVEQWLGLLPPSLIQDDIDLLLAQGWVRHARGAHVPMAATIDRLRTHIDDLAQDDPVRMDAGIEIAVMEAFSLHKNGEDPSLLDTFERGFERMQRSRRFAGLPLAMYHPIFVALDDRDRALRILDEIISADTDLDDRYAAFRAIWGLQARVLILQTHHDMTTVARNARLAVARAESASATRQLSVGTYLYGSSLLELDDLAAAEAHLRAACISPHTGIAMLIESTDRLAVTLEALGRPDEADAAIESLLDRLTRHQLVDFLPVAQMTLVRLALNRGDKDRARALVDTTRGAPNVRTPHFLQALTRIEAGTCTDLDKATVLLDEIQSSPILQYWTHQRIKANLARALLHQRLGNLAESRQVLESALREGERTEHIRSFIDHSPGIRSLVTSRTVESPDWPYLQHLAVRIHEHECRHASSNPTLIAATGNGLSDPLSDRELDIIHGLQQRLSNKEIAIALSISPLTVKSHTHNIYGKLGVNSRREAVARAVSLGVILDHE